MKKILISLSIVLSSVLFAETKVECQNTPILVLNYEELMCPSDLETISENKDIRIKRVVARYKNINQATVLKLSKIPDLELKKRLVLNPSTNEDLKTRLKREIEKMEDDIRNTTMPPKIQAQNNAYFNCRS